MDQLMKFADGDIGFIQDMLNAFITNTPESLKIIERLFEEKNWVQLATELHKIKPTFRYLSVNVAEEKVKTAEHLCKDDIRPAEIEKLIDEIFMISRAVLEEASHALNQM